MKLISHVRIVAALLVTACGGGGTDDTRPPGGGDQPAATVDPDAELRTIVMTVPAMSCPLCVRSIRVRLEEEGLRDIRIDLDTKLVRARFDPERITPAEVEALVEDQGFPVEDRRVVGPGSAGRGGVR